MSTIKKYPYQGIEKSNNLIAEFLKLPVVKEYENGTVVYKLWSKIIPDIGPEEYTYDETLIWRDEVHAFQLMFHIDWNWLMYAANEVRKVMVDLDSDMNNLNHEMYQRLRSIFLHSLHTFDINYVHSSIVNFIDWHNKAHSKTV